jgi:hypothetical protein
MIRRMSHRALVLGPVLMGLLLAVQPAAAASGIHETGLVGPYQINDDHDTTRGANCDYETHKTNGAYLLDDISVRAPFMHARDRGVGNQTQWVGWQYKIQRTPTATTNFHTIFTSSVVKAKATETAIAPFTRRKWTAPETVRDGNYRVKVIMLWYKPGTSTVEQGRVVANIDYYHVRGGGPDTIRQTDCYKAN